MKELPNDISRQNKVATDEATLDDVDLNMTSPRLWLNWMLLLDLDGDQRTDLVNKKNKT